jgi:hypothetical protein
MSQEQTAFILRDNVPDRSRLEAAIRRLGFDLTLDPEYLPFESSGYLPCTLNGKRSGFDIHFDSTSELIESFPKLMKPVGDRDCAIALRWSGDLAECACVLIVCAALAHSFNAVVYYHDGDDIYQGDQLIPEVKKVLEVLANPARGINELPQPERTKKPWWKIW